MTAFRHGRCYPKRMAQAYDKKVRPGHFAEGDFVLKKFFPLKKIPNENLGQIMWVLF